RGFVGDGSVVDAQRARSEGRILLTRDHGLAARRGLRVILVTTSALETQLAQVNAVVGIPPRPPRCMTCNVLLERIPSAAARSHVPPYVAQTQQDFRRCPHCGKIFWPGTHWEGISQRLARALELKPAQESTSGSG
ncbi:MAG TPA: Mut7-C RNAse domain-containing protein, partial [Anaerolineae bacterium]|nr:Mut7-C RNAse domain-containing protein [Anaerolineae bacterium]